MLTSYTRFVEVYMCRVVHNPTVAAAVMLAGAAIIHRSQWQHVLQTGQHELLFAEDYLWDLVSNVINVVFLARFSLRWSTPWALEAVLFGLQNYGCCRLLIGPETSFLYDESLSATLKVFLVAQVLFPYLVMAMNVAGTWWGDDATDAGLEGSSASQRARAFLFDSNNSFLPIFISHSFVLVNTSFPLVEPTAVGRNAVLAYMLASFSLKFYCIYRFILFEVAALSSGGSEPIIPLNEKKMHGQRPAGGHSARGGLTARGDLVAVASCVLLSAVDAVYIGASVL